MRAPINNKKDRLDRLVTMFKELPSAEFGLKYFQAAHQSAYDEVENNSDSKAWIRWDQIESVALYNRKLLRNACIAIEIAATKHMEHPNSPKPPVLKPLKAEKGRQTSLFDRKPSTH
jgi:hypothetical protein